MTFRVWVDDNYHYMDQEARYRLGDYQTLEAAIAAAQAIVDDFLISSHEPGMAADELYGLYTGFGEDPFIVAEGHSGVLFSAWDYARQRCQELCGPAQSE